VGGVSIEALNKPTDVAQARRIRAKLEKILKFVQDRELVEEFWDRKRFIQWINKFHLEDRLTDEWINKNVEFSIDGITCKSHLNLSETAITYLPNNLTVEENLILKGCKCLERLPDNLTVKGSLFLESCILLTQLPEDLKLDGALRAAHCTSLTSLPDNLKLGGALILEGCISLEYLSDGLIVEGDIEVRGCSAKVVEKADELKVRGQIKRAVWK
jgi:hypothetical protein